MDNFVYMAAVLCSTKGLSFTIVATTNANFLKVYYGALMGNLNIRDYLKDKTREAAVIQMSLTGYVPANHLGQGISKDTAVRNTVSIAIEYYPD